MQEEIEEMHVFFNKRKETSKPKDLNKIEPIEIFVNKLSKFVKWFFDKHYIYNKKNDGRCYYNISFQNGICRLRLYLGFINYLEDNAYFYKEFYSFKLEKIEQVEEELEIFKKDFTLYLLSEYYFQEKLSYQISKMVLQIFSLFKK